MGIPTWAQVGATTLLQQQQQQHQQQQQQIRHPFNRHYPSAAPAVGKFPVHKIENSPTLAQYQGPAGVQNGTENRHYRSTPGQDLDLTTLLPRCQPDEVLFKVKSVRFVEGEGSDGNVKGQNGSEDHNLGTVSTKKMVDLTSVEKLKEVEVTTVKQEKNLIPTSTMVMEEKPGVWYKKFSRNLHGLKKDKPYSNLQWPPPPPMTN